MGRLTLVLLLFTFLADPDLRARAQPYAHRALDPAYGWLARGRVAEIARAIESRRAVGMPTPSSEGLPDFLVAYYQRDEAALDPWGRPYFLARDMWTVRVASAGPDGVRHTDDDVVSPPLRAPGD